MIYYSVDIATFVSSNCAESLATCNKLKSIDWFWSTSASCVDTWNVLYTAAYGFSILCIALYGFCVEYIVRRVQFHCHSMCSLNWQRRLRLSTRLICWQHEMNAHTLIGLRTAFINYSCFRTRYSLVIPGNALVFPHPIARVQRCNYQFDEIRIFTA